MQKYELLVVLPGTLDDAQAEARMKEVLALVKENSSEAEIHPLGKNRLAYPINQIRYGYYYTVVFSTEPNDLKVLEKKISLSRDLLRTMISHFNTTLTTAQRIVYSTNDLGVTTMMEGNKPAAVVAQAPVVAEAPVVVEAVEPEKEPEAAPVAPARAAKKAPEASIEEISKKLDDIIGGDMMPGM